LTLGTIKWPSRYFLSALNLNLEGLNSGFKILFQKSRMGGLPGRSNMVIPILAEPPTGEAIPTPDTVPARKMSIIQVKNLSYLHA